MQSRIPFSGKGARSTAKTRPLPPLRKKNKNLLTLLREESPAAQNRPIIHVLAVVNTITTTTIMTVNTETCIFVSLILSRRMGLGNRTSDFDCSIDLSCWAIIMVESCGELQLRPLLMTYGILATSCYAPYSYKRGRPEFCSPPGTVRMIEPRKTSEIPSLGWGASAHRKLTRLARD